MNDGAFYAYVIDCFEACPELLALLDATDGIRRMDAPAEQDFDACLCLSNLLTTPIVGHTTEAVVEAYLTFTPYVRLDSSALRSGDLLCGDILFWVNRLFGCNRIKQACCPPEPSEVLILASWFDGDAFEANVWEPLQAWRKAKRYRFYVAYQCCRPGQAIPCR